LGVMLGFWCIANIAASSANVAIETFMSAGPSLQYTKNTEMKEYFPEEFLIGFRIFVWIGHGSLL